MSTSFLRAVIILALFSIFFCFPSPVAAKSCIWQSGVGNWSDAAQWSCGAAPGVGDSAFINGGTVTVDSGVSIVDLVMLGGVLTGNNDLEMDTFTWGGGTLGGSHAVTVKTQFSINGAGPHGLADQCVLNNQGALTWATTDSITVSGKPIFNNAQGATFTVQSAGANLLSGGAGTFNNTGTLTKASSGSLTINPEVFANFGTVDLTGPGQLTLFTSNLATSPQTGAYNVPAGSSLRFYAGNYVFGTGSSIAGAGNVEFYSWTVSFEGTSVYNISGTTSVTGGSVRFTNGISLIGLGETLSISNGMLDLSTKTTSPLMLNTFNMSGGVLAGSDSLIVSTLNWSGGEMTGTGSTTAATTLSATGSAAHTLSASRVLNNNGTLTWNGNASLRMVGTPVFNNGSGAIFTVQSAGAYLVSGGAGIFNNYGTLDKTTTGDLFINPAVFRNNNTVNLTGPGKLILMASNLEESGQSGTYNVPSSAVLRFSSGSFAFNPGSSISGTGAVDFASGTVNFNVGSLYNVSGPVSVSGTVYFNPGMTVNSLGSSLTLSGGRLDLSSGAGSALSVQSFDFTGGTLTGSDALTAATLNWSSGEMAGPGTTTVTTAIAVSGAGSRALSGSRVLTNAGVLTWNSTSNLYLVGTAVFNNASGAAFNIQSAGSYLIFGGAGTFNNAGTLTKAYKGDLFINPGVFQNSGTVDLKGAGLLSLLTATAESSPQSGMITLPPGTSLRFYGGTIDFNAGSMLAGPGSVEFYSGTVNFNGGSACNVTGNSTVSGGEVHFNPGAAALNLGTVLTISSGTLDLSSGAITPLAVTSLNQGGGTLAGSDDLTADTYAWVGGDQAGTGRTKINKGITFTGAAVRALKEERTLANAGTMTWDGAGYITLAGTPVFENMPGGLVTITNSSTYLFSGGAGTVSNAGTLRLPVGQVDVAAFNQSPTGVTEFVINGKTPVFLHTQIKAADVRLDGTAKITSQFPFTLNDQFALITSTTQAGKFATLALPKLASGRVWHETYTPAGWNMTVQAGVYMAFISAQ